MVRPLWVAALSRIIIVVAEELRGRMAKLLCSLELIFATHGCLVRVLVTRGVYRDSIESYRPGFGLVNQPGIGIT